VLPLLAVLGGLGIGLTLGLLGGGGSVLTVPLLLAIGVAPKPAIALSLGVVATTAGVAVGSHARARRVDWRAALWLLPAAALGGFAGGRAAGAFSDGALLFGFALLMVGAGVAMLHPRRVERLPVERPALVAVAGAAIGFVTGLVGAGGGFLFVPALALAGGLPMHRAVGTSLVAIAVNAAAALLGQLEHADVPLALALWLTGAAVAGALLGARLAGRLPERTLRRAFGVLVLLVAAWMFGRSGLLAGLITRAGG
jgi:uncharacterized membrane protein YfcA